MSDTGIQRIYRHESTQYTTVPNWVVRDPKYTPNAFRLLAYLLSHADGYELTYGQIERQTTLGRYAINQAAAFLIEEGWLEWQRVKGQDGRWLAKQWIIKDPAAIIPLSNGSTMEPFHYGTANGHKEEQLLEKNTKRETNTKREVQFDEFWNIYPRKEGKKPAFKAFSSAMSRTSFEDILAGVEAYKRSDRVKRGFIKLPATWLNEDAWEDAATQVQTEQVGTERREREVKASKQLIEEIKKTEAESAPPPKCPHGTSIARCVKCIKTIS